MSELALRLEGRIPEVVDCVPRRVFFAAVAAERSEAVAGEVRLRCPKVVALEITASSKSPHVDVAVSPGEGLQEQRLHVRLKPGVPKGFFSTEVEIVTNVPEMPRLVLPVAALVR